MPHYFDFNVFKEGTVKEVELTDSHGWVSPLTIEYAFANFASDTNTLYWRVKGTAHTFTISAKEFNILSKGEFELHFKEALKMFRDDMVAWYNQGLPEEWMREYVFMYSNYISL